MADDQDNSAEQGRSAPLVISIQAHGRTVRLGTTAKWRRAIENGDLQPDTPVEVDLAEGETETRRAGDLEVLRPLFEAAGFQLRPPDAPPEDLLPPVEPPQQPESPSREGPGVEDAGEPAPVSPPSPAVEDRLQPPPPPPPPPPPVEATRFPAKRVLAAVAGVILLIFVMRGCFDGKPSSSGLAAAETVSVYVRRDVMIRAGPGKAFAAVSKAPRGEILSGSWVTASDGETRWLSINDGTYKGAFAWGMNLSANAPPALTGTIGADVELATGGAVHVEPSADSPVVDTIADGSTVWIVGRTDGWLEIGLKQGGVGYLALN